MRLPGFAFSRAKLIAMGFQPLSLGILSLSIPLNGGKVGCKWRTLGAVPKSQGLYLFSVEHPVLGMTVAYLGMTQDLWMVTKGRTSQGSARPGNRYGSPYYAGDTRRRVNVLIARHARRGCTITHWVLPLKLQRHQLEVAESALIRRWNLRARGWNIR